MLNNWTGCDICKDGANLSASKRANTHYFQRKGFYSSITPGQEIGTGLICTSCDHREKKRYAQTGVAPFGEAFQMMLREAKAPNCDVFDPDEDLVRQYYVYREDCTCWKCQWERRERKEWLDADLGIHP